MGHQELHDLIPEGCISLRDAYERVVKALWGDAPPTGYLNHYGLLATFHPVVIAACRATLARIQDQLDAELIAAFADEELDAFVRVPGETENRCIPARTWRDAFFSDRVFLIPRITVDHGGYWTSLIGRTPFVRRSQFDSWLVEQVARRDNPRAKLSPANQAVREHLISLAMNGVMSSTEVEELARKWHMPPLAASANYLDPMELPRWTLCMAVAWITWADPDAVREMMADYCDTSWTWQSCTRHIPIENEQEWVTVDGEELICLPTQNLTLLGLDEATNSDPRETTKRMSVKSARELLWQKLGEDRITATGIDTSDKVSVIPAHEWSYLTLAGRRSGADYLVWSKTNLTRAYTDITLSREAVAACWAPKNPELPKREKVGRADLISQSPRIELAIDHPCEAIRFTGGPLLNGNSYKLIARLAGQHELDVSAQKTAVRFAFTKREVLEGHFGIDNERLRKWVERARRDIERKFLQCFGFVLDTHDVIQSDSWKGYRLNPEVRIVARNQLEPP